MVKGACSLIIDNDTVSDSTDKMMMFIGVTN